MDYKEKIIQSHPPRGVGILNKKSLAGSITHIKSTNRHICRINWRVYHLLFYQFTCHVINNVLVLPLNILYVLIILNNYIIGTGDYNTSFSRTNAQTQCLCDFMDLNKLAVPWDHNIANKEDTYCNFVLNHFSCIDHFIVSNNVFKSLCSHDVLLDVINPSSHSLIPLLFDFKANHSRMMPNNIHNVKGHCCWDRATKEDINRYCSLLDEMLDTVNIPDCVRYNDLSKHKHSLDVFFQSIIKCCLDVSKDCIPNAGLKTKKRNDRVV